MLLFFYSICGIYDLVHQDSQICQGWLHYSKCATLSVVSNNTIKQYHVYYCTCTVEVHFGSDANLNVLLERVWGGP